MHSPQGRWMGTAPLPTASTPTHQARQHTYAAQQPPTMSKLKRSTSPGPEISPVTILFPADSWPMRCSRPIPAREGRPAAGAGAARGGHPGASRPWRRAALCTGHPGPGQQAPGLGQAARLPRPPPTASLTRLPGGWPPRPPPPPPPPGPALGPAPPLLALLVVLAPPPPLPILPAMLAGLPRLKLAGG